MREAGDFPHMAFELLLQKCCCCLAFDIGIRCNDELFYLPLFATLDKFPQLKLLRPHTIDRREYSVEHVIETLVSRFFEGNDIEGFLNDKNCLALTTSISTERTFLLHCNHLAHSAIVDSFTKIAQCFPKTLG